jgi:DNA (cytosine-5)-methyltransferase 1
MADKCTIPAIDLFAGPGGLGEGFSASRNRGGSPHFDIRLSIEKEELAHRTLKLRAFFRQFPTDRVPEDYYNYLRGQITRDALFAAHEPAAHAASDEALCAELGATKPGHAALRERISTALEGSKGWVLLGGPPCQAYSLVGRSRNKGNKEYVAADDKRQTLYVEYLHVIGDHWPAVFVMENVKGMLSASLDGRRVFERIQEDLRDPATALARENRPNASTP